MFHVTFDGGDAVAEKASGEAKPLVAKGLEFVDSPVLDELHPDCDFMGAFKRDSEPFTPPENPTTTARQLSSALAIPLVRQKDITRSVSFVIGSFLSIDSFM